MSCHVMSCHVMSCHVMSCHVMSCHVMSLCFFHFSILLFISADVSSSLFVSYLFHFFFMSGPLPSFLRMSLQLSSFPFVIVYFLWFFVFLCLSLSSYFCLRFFSLVLTSAQLCSLLILPVCLIVAYGPCPYPNLSSSHLLPRHAKKGLLESGLSQHQVGRQHSWCRIAPKGAPESRVPIVYKQH